MAKPFFLLLCALSFASGVVSAPAAASDGLLIWNPTKTSDTAYTARLGTRMPGWTFASAGVDVGVASAVKGGPVDTPVKLWGRVTASQLQTPAYEIRRDIDVRLNALTGGGAAEMSYVDKQIVSGEIDLELRRTIGVSYDGLSQQWSGISANQAVRLSSPTVGTAFVMRAGAVDDFKRLGAGMAVEQSLTDAITITGNLERAVGSDLSASINARYSLSW